MRKVGFGQLPLISLASSPISSNNRSGPATLCLTEGGWLTLSHLGQSGHIYTVDPTPDEPLRVLVQEVDIATLHAATEKHPIDASHEVDELIFRSLHHLVG